MQQTEFRIDYLLSSKLTFFVSLQMLGLIISSLLPSWQLSVLPPPQTHTNSDNAAI